MPGGLPRLAEEAASLLTDKSPLVRLDRGFPVVVVGDTHGYPEVSMWALRIAERLNARHVVFLGDYVDRGPRGVENLEFLLERMLGDPGYLILLRGNHESPTMNYYYGFRDELVSKLGYQALEPVERLYACLPIAAKLDTIVLLHGGVPCRRCHGGEEEPPSLAEIARRAEEVRCTRAALEPEDPIVFQVLWNDPRGEIEWFSPNIRGPGTYYYGWRAWTRFLQASGAKLLIRAHEVVDGVRVTWRGEVREGLTGEYGLEELSWRVVTVFSSLYHGMGAGAVVVYGDKLVFTRYPEERL